MKNLKGGVAIKTVSLFLLCVLLGGCDFFVSTEQRFEKAKTLYVSKDYRAASIELKKLLQEEPENVDARILLGEVALWLGQAPDAESHFDKALKAGVSKQAIAIPLAQTYLANGKFSKLLETLKPDMMPAADSKAKLLSLRGKAYIELQNLAQAEDQFKQSVAVKPGFKDGQLGLARIALIKGDFASADRRLAKLLKQDGEFTEALVVQAQSLMLRQQYSEAEKVFAHLLNKELFKLLPAERFIISVGLVESQYRQGLYEKMGKSVGQLAQQYPQHPMPKYLQALAEYSVGRYIEAVNHLQDLQSIAPDYPAAQFLMGASSYALNNLEQANVHLNKAIQVQPQNKQAQKLLAVTYMRLNQPDKAADLVEGMLNKTGSEEEESDLLMLLGKASLKAGDVDSGLNYLERSGTQSQFELAAAYIASGKMDLGVDILEGLPETEEHQYRKEMLLVLASVKKRDLDAALQLVEQMVKKHQEDFAVLSLAGSVHMLARKHDKAQTYYQKATRIDPGNIGAKINIGRLHLVQGNVEPAIRQFEQIIQKHPDNLTALSLLAGVAVNQKRFDDAESYLLTAVKAHPANPQAVVSLAKFHLLNKDFQAAERAASEGLKQFADNELLLSGLAAALLGQQKQAQAAEVLSKAIVAGNKSPLLLYNLARVKLLLNQLPEAKTLLQQALEQVPDNTTFIALLATVESQLGQYEAASRLIRSAEGRQLGSARLSELKGDLLVRKKDFLAAEKAYQQALQLNASGSLHIKVFKVSQLATLKPAEKPLLEWVRQHPQDTQVRLFLAQYYQSGNRRDAAIKQYVELVEQMPDNVIALNNLAWLYHLEDNAKAVDMAEKAYRLRPDDGAIIDTLGWILVERGQYDKGVKLLQKAVKAAPDVLAIQYHLAVGLAKQGNVQGAKALLARLLAVKEGFQERSAAENLYATLR